MTTAYCYHCGVTIYDWRETHSIYAHLCRSCGTLKQLQTKTDTQKENNYDCKKRYSHLSV